MIPSYKNNTKCLFNKILKTSLFPQKLNFQVQDFFDFDYLLMQRQVVVRNYPFYKF